MGSRSYFHYADITAVVSRGKYVGIDPLNVIRDGGWEMPLDSGAAELAEAVVAPRAHAPRLPAAGSAGATSAGRPRCRSTPPGLYTRVSSFWQWLAENISNCINLYCDRFA